MNRYLASFKRIAAQVTCREELSMRLFIGQYGLNDFLVDEAANSDPADIAAKALMHFCVADGQFNGFLVGLQTALQFLNEHCDAPNPGRQMRQTLTDLRKILDGAPTLRMIKQWIRGHYK
ncbi:MAG TPA: hypothetical protein VE988_12110 [Gemmataceae bacterium]|nr:hypothetical protein [Gemmataceae bacterium]